MEEEILSMTKSYFKMIGEDLSDEIQLLLIRSLIDNYKAKRAYPAFYTQEMIDEDVNRFLEIRKSEIAMEIIPEMYGRVGGEGLSMLTDAGTTRMWKNSTLLHDVVPICEVV